VKTLTFWSAVVAILFLWAALTSLIGAMLHRYFAVSRDITTALTWAGFAAIAFLASGGRLNERKPWRGALVISAIIGITSYLLLRFLSG
jgi:hypothetical protein